MYFPFSLPLNARVFAALAVTSFAILAPSVRAADVPFGEGRQALQPAAKLSALSVQGNHFVDATGKTVVLRGLAITDPAALIAKGKWGRKYFEAAKGWNANVVRLPVHPAEWRKAGEEAYLKRIDEAVQWSGELGMYVIMDWHSIGNILTGVYQRPIYITSKDETFRFWYTIAERYKGNPVVAMYELFNEPTNRDGMMGRMPWAGYKAFIEELIFMIRKIDPKATPLVAGFNWGYDLTSVRDEPIGFPGVAYVTHPYPQKRREKWEENWQRDWGFVADKYPVVATEFGFMSADGPGAHVPVIADEVYGEAIIEFFEKRGISWTPWVFDAEWSPQLIENWDFKPTRQGVFFRDKLKALNK